MAKAHRTMASGWNGSTLANSMNSAKIMGGEEAATALEELARVVDDSEDADAIECFNAFTDELEKPKPKGVLLRSFWASITSALPAVSEMTSLAERIAPLLQ
jgi:hypothetical protein